MIRPEYLLQSSGGDHWAFLGGALRTPVILWRKNTIRVVAAGIPQQGIQRRRQGLVHARERGGNRGDRDGRVPYPVRRRGGVPRDQDAARDRLDAAHQ